MRSSTLPPTAHRPSRSHLLTPYSGRSVLVAVLTVILLVGLLPAVTHAEASELASAERAQADQLVFSMGELAAVNARAVTLTFADGQAETYRLAPETTIQTQNGDTQTLADLDVGAMVVVIAREDDPTALTIVNGGDAGFHEAGPADMRGHENDPACAAREDQPLP